MDNARAGLDDPTLLPNRQKALALVGVLLGMLLAALDQTIVATAGPTIQRDLAIPPSLYTWITTSYLVASTVCVPIWGKLSDSLGRRRTLLWGIGVFLVGSALCGVSGSAMQLILARAVQGVGSASLFTSAFTVIADLFVPAERGRYQGIFGSVFGLSSIFGPLVGGFLTDTVGWHWCFFVNVPLGAVAVAFIVTRMPPLKRADSRPLVVDIAGVLALVAFAVPLLLGLSFGHLRVAPGETGWPWLSWPIAGFFGTSLVGLVAFLAVEGRARDPIVDVRVVSQRTVAVGLATAFLAGTAFLGAVVFMPLFMVNVAGASATEAGLTTLPLTMGLVTSNITSGQLASRAGRTKPFLLGSMVIASLALWILGAVLTVDSTVLGVAPFMFFVGVGLGPALPLVPLTVQNAVPPAVIGAVTSLATFFRQMGATVGLAILGTVFAARLASPGREGFAAATSTTVMAAGLLQLLALFAALFLPDLKLRGRAPSSPSAPAD